MNDPTIWTRLAAPFPTDRIAWRQDGKVVTKGGGDKAPHYFARFVPYLEANDVRQRLDEVCPGWQSELTPLTNAADMDGEAVQAFKCRLSIPNPLSGSGLTIEASQTSCRISREDCGQGSDYKSAATDAFKRAAMRFGIGAFLYDTNVHWCEMDGDGKFAKPLVDPGESYVKKYGPIGGPVNGKQPPQVAAKHEQEGEQRPDPTGIAIGAKSRTQTANRTAPLSTKTETTKPSTSERGDGDAEDDGPVMPFGTDKGRLLSALAADRLRSTLSWIDEKATNPAKWTTLKAQIQAELRSRETAAVKAHYARVSSPSDVSAPMFADPDPPPIDDDDYVP